MAGSKTRTGPSKLIKKKKGPKSWTSPSQRIFLFSHLDQYKIAQSQGSYLDFWPGFFEEWEKEFPTREEAFPGRDLKSFTDEEQTDLQEAIQDRREQLQSWYRWKCNRRGRTANQLQTKLAKELLSSRTRNPKESEVYTKLCYKDKIKPVAEARWKEQKAETSGAKLRVVNEVARELLDKEQPEVKEQVKAAVVDVQVKRKAAAHSSRTAEEYAYSINESPALLGHFLRALAEKTGWAYTVLMGGPDPGTTNGDISVASFHVGETPMGHTFGQAHPKFECSYMEPYSDFLRHVYTPQTRQARSLKNTPKPDGRGVEGEGWQSQSPEPFIWDEAPTGTNNNALSTYVPPPEVPTPNINAPIDVSQWADTNAPVTDSNAPVISNAPHITTPSDHGASLVTNASSCNNLLSNYTGLYSSVSLPANTPPLLPFSDHIANSLAQHLETPPSFPFSDTSASSESIVNADAHGFTFDFSTLDFEKMDFGLSGLESLEHIHNAGWPNSPEFSEGLSNMSLVDELNEGLATDLMPNWGLTMAIPLSEVTSEPSTPSAIQDFGPPEAPLHLGALSTPISNSITAIPPSEVTSKPSPASVVQDTGLQEAPLHLKALSTPNSISPIILLPGTNTFNPTVAIPLTEHQQTQEALQSLV